MFAMRTESTICHPTSASQGISIGTKLEFGYTVGESFREGLESIQIAVGALRRRDNFSWRSKQRLLTSVTLI